MIRRLLVLAALGAMGLITGPAAALTISVASPSADPGQKEVAVAISVDNAKGIAGGDLTLTYSSAVLTAKQVKAGDLVSGLGIALIPNLNTPGQVKVSMAGAAGISAGSGALVTLTFEVKAGAAAGRYELGLKATLRDENGAVLPATLKNGAITIKAATASAPQLKVSATTLSFDSTKVGASSQKTLTLSNTGKASLTVTKIAVAGTDAAHFKVSPTTATVAAGGTRTLTLTFAPTAAGAKSASLSLTHNAAGSPTRVRLKGVGVAPPAGLQLSVGSGNGSPGGTVAIPISVNNAKGIAGGDLTISYPSTVLTAKQVKGGDLVTGAGITVIPNLATAGQVKISMAGAAGISSGSGALVTLTFEVKAGAAVGTYELGLKATLRDENGAALLATLKSGTLTVKATSSGKPVALPAQAALLPNYPNPFNASTILRYALAEAGPVRLAIYNAAGTQVRLLVAQPQGAGVYEVVWDGRDEQGRNAASGLYLDRLETGGRRQTQKLLLLK